MKGLGMKGRGCVLRRVRSEEVRGEGLYTVLNNSLKMHEENTKKITAVSVVLYVIKFHVNLHKL